MVLKVGGGGGGGEEGRSSVWRGGKEGGEWQE